ncbi:hypothetical protein ABW20_dc0105347 [Dactylellina cionopaga]|nr:hypothetical protein ABW20_dc0105347 [Dactylellina cionopaga]
MSSSKQQIREHKIAKTPLPSFQKTFNAPLDTLLQTLHRDQFMIDHLPDHYRRLVVRTTRHKVLAEQASQQAFARGTNPSTATLTVTIDSQTLALRPISRRTLHGAKTLTEALNLISSPTEYDILPELVQAFAFSKIEISPKHWRKLIRACGLAGRPGVAIKIAHEGIVHRRNGFNYTRASLREMIRAQFVRFLLPDAKDATKAVQRARGVVGLARRWKEQFDTLKARRRLEERAPEWLRIDPVVRGSLVFLQAGKVELEAVPQRMAEKKSGDQVEPAYAIARDAIRDWEPVLQGLQWTQTVLQNSNVKDAEIEQWLPAASKLLTQAVENWKPIATSKGKNERVGMQIYEGAYEDLNDWYITDVNKKPVDVVKDKIVLREEDDSKESKK